MKLQNELDRLLVTFSKEEVIEALRVPSSDDVLSIISDGGMHRQPDDLLIGERYIFSNGMIDTTSDHSVDMHIGMLQKTFACIEAKELVTDQAVLLRSLVASSICEVNRL